MKVKIGVFFILAVLIPTSLLAYFGLLAVKNEKAVVERNMRQKYEAMTDITEKEIRAVLSQAPEDQLTDPQKWESLLIKGTGVFKDEVFLFDAKGAPLGAQTARSLQEADYVRDLNNLPYRIGVFERHPLLLANLQAKKKGLTFYIAIIVFSAFSILGGSVVTLSALSREWRQARLKSEFASHLSHDLRRPLTSIRMFAEMLSQDRVPSEAKKREYYAIITEESDKLTHLANNILDFSRIEEGRRKYNICEQDVTRVVRETVERFKVYTIQKTREVALWIDPAGPAQQGRPAGKKNGYPVVRMDAGAVSQALMNLLTNADKYSPPEGKITVRLRRAKNQAVIEVADCGHGVPKAEQKKIFQKFYRLAHQDVLGVEGSGLGLALVKYTAEAHGGRVAVESEEGKGSTFSIILPV